MTPQNADRWTRIASRWHRWTSVPWAPFAALALLTLVVLWNGWVCDDAYITFRVADNFLEGHGLRWNVSERVQAYSNPLWLILFIPAFAVLGDACAAAIVMGVGCTVGALLVARRIAASRGTAVLGVLICALSKAFVDYSTSGLENPLSWLLLAVLAVSAFRLEAEEGNAPRRCLMVSLACALLVINRLDAGLFAGPVWLWLLWRRPGWKGIGCIALGALPLLLWLGFATLYYGFPLPNTAYAKLDNGWSASALVDQGLTYLFDSLVQDPITLATIVAGIGVALARWSPARLVLLAGVVLHLAYVVKIGGDFMSGRFLSLPFFAAVLLVTSAPARTAGRTVDFPIGWLRIAVLLPALGILNPDGPLVNRPFWRGAMTTDEAKALYVTPNAHGICDERAFYYPTCGLARWPWLKRLPDHSYREQGERFRAGAESRSRSTGQEEPPRAGVVRGNIGFFGFFAGPVAEIVDPLALSDAFLARLPPKGSRSRIGHVLREVPQEYLASRSSGTNRLTDPALRELYDRITLLTRKPLFDPGRIRLLLATLLP